MNNTPDPSMSTPLASGLVIPAIFMKIPFNLGARYIWSGVGNLIYDAQTYKGIGTLGNIGTIVENIDANADETTINLSGIDPVLQAECLTDIQLGAPASIWCALMLEGTTLIGAPYLLFSGIVDRPTATTGPNEICISLARA